MGATLHVRLDGSQAAQGIHQLRFLEPPGLPGEVAHLPVRGPDLPRDLSFTHAAIKKRTHAEQAAHVTHRHRMHSHDGLPGPQ